MNAYYTAKNGIPCKLVKNGLHSRGVLFPCKSNEDPTIFGIGYQAGARKSARAIERTIKVADRMRKSILDQWEKVADLVSHGNYTIEKKKAVKNS